MDISATLAVNEETARRRALGLPVLALGFGEAGLPVHPRLRAELSDAAGEASYGPVAGIDELRGAAAGYWTRRALPTEPDHVIAGPGSKPLLFALLHAGGGPVAVPKPSWVSYAAQAALLDLPTVHVPVADGEGGVPDPTALEVAATKARREGAPLGTVVVTLPDNPTGRLARPETVRSFCEVAERHDLLIVSDEIYRDLVHDDDACFVSPATLAPDRTVVTTGLSKTLALGGWRIGVARFPEGSLGGRIRADVASIASEIWSAPAHPVQRAAAWALAEPECIRERVSRSRLLHGRVARAVAEEFRRAGVAVPAPQGGFYLYPDFASHRDDLSAAGITSGAQLARALLEGPGIATLPGSAFGDDAEALRLRVATSLLYGNTPDEQEEALLSNDPVSLPWTAAHLDHLRSGLAWLTDRV